MAIDNAFNRLKREIGIGQATLIDQIEITWAKTQKKQVFRNIKPNQFIKIKEGNNTITNIKVNKLNFPTEIQNSTICKT